MVRQAHHDRGKTVRPERFDPPFALSLSKGGRSAQHRLVEGCLFRLSVTFFGLRAFA
jgi:hypothetical protein